MNRPLLPYEHQMVEALGVTEQEYLDFLAATHDFESSPEEVLAKPQAATFGVAEVALILTIVGMIFQVAGALLAPKQEGDQTQRRRREQRFSPRFGFNSSQDLAQYGDPVNLVYCNTEHNRRGALRVSTSLVWSSIESAGSSQFMQLLLVLGAARIKRLIFARTAFGQLPLGQFSGSNTWLYYNENGRVSFNDRRIGDNKDPAKLDGARNSDDVCRIITGSNRLEGYSQAFTPSSLTSIGVYDPIPINVEVQERRTSGRERWANNGIVIRGNGWGAGGNNRYDPGERITVIFGRARRRQSNVAQEAAKDLRYQAVSSLDQSAIYMLGAAKFKLVSVTDETNLDKNEVRAVFECIEAGRIPSAPYNEKRASEWDEKVKDDIEDAREILSGGVEENTEDGPSILTRKDSGLRNRVVLDPSDYRNDKVRRGDVRFSFAGQRYNFSGNETIRWQDELDRRQEFRVPKGGSIGYTQELLKEFLSNKPTISTKRLRDELEDDLEKARALRDDVINGKYDRALRRDAKKNRAYRIIKDKIEEQKDKLDDLGGSRVQLDKRSKRISGERVLLESTGIKGKKEKRVAEVEKRIEELREQRDEFLEGDISARREIFVNLIRNATIPFRGPDGNRYAAGIKAIKRRLAGLSGERTTDRIGVRTIRGYFRSLIREKEEALAFARFILKNWEDLQGAADDNFYTKCIVKADYAAYQTVTACTHIKFALRCKLFRRIQGRQKKYGEKDAPDGYRLSDNGLKGRMAFFKVEYRRIGANAYRAVPIIFAVRRSADQDNFIGLNFNTNTFDKYEFKFLPIGDIGAELRDNRQPEFAFIENSGKRSRIDLPGGDQFRWTGGKVRGGFLLKNALEERGPLYTNEWDLFSNRSDTSVQFSFEGGPEFRITAVTEQQRENIRGKYADMSMMALSIYSGKGVQDLRSVTAFVEEGKDSWIVNEGTGQFVKTQGSTSYAPDIFIDTVLDRENGIGKYAKREGIDGELLAKAKRFCKNNGLGTQLFMDGVIADITPWRQFWAEVAPYSLLEFAKVGGKETLIPAIPCDRNGRANREVIISALFTAGNILEGSYKEEFLDYGDGTQDLIATIIYRDTERQDVFPRDSSVQVSLRSANESDAMRQTFDISQFVSNKEQAILYGKLLCNQRRWLRRGVEFKTFPTNSPISPGAYIYVDIGLTRWQRRASGKVMEGGVLNAPLSDGVVNGTYSVLLYQSGRNVVSLTNVVVNNGTAPSLANRAGWMFVLGVPANRKRVYRTTEVSMDEEGEVTVKAVEHPCEELGGKTLSKVADFDDRLFRVV
jgi:hypothetical protein